MNDDLYQRYLDRALKFLSYRPRSEKEIRNKLTEKKASKEIVDKIIAWLKEQRFINDEEFARWWLEQRTTFRPKGERFIRLELKQKGIENDIINSVFDSALKEGMGHLGIANESVVRDEKMIAKEIVIRKLPKYKDLPKFEIYKKIGAHLARRGFNWDTIKASIDDVLQNGV